MSEAAGMNLKGNKSGGNRQGIGRRKRNRGITKLYYNFEKIRNYFKNSIWFLIL